MKELLETIVKNIVDNPDQVEIIETQENDMIKLEIKVSDSDVGKVIGKQGRVISAVRMIVKIKAKIEDQKVVIEVIS